MGFSETDRRQVAKGTLFNITGGASMASFKAFQFVLRQMFGGEAFGLYIIAYSLMELLSNLVLGGFSDAVTYHAVQSLPQSQDTAEEAQARTDRLYRTLASCIRWPLLISTLISSFLILSAESLYQLIWTNHDASLVRLLQVILLGLPLLSLIHMLSESARAHLDMRPPALIVQTLFPGLSIAFALLYHNIGDLGIFSMAYGLLTSLIICIPFALWAFSKHFSVIHTLRFLVTGQGNPEMIRFAFPQCLNMAANMGLVKMDALILSAFVPANAVGIYTLMVDLAQLVRLPKMAFSGIFGPLVARYQSTHNRAGIQESLREISLITALLGLCVLLVVQVFHADFIIGQNQQWPFSPWIPWLLCIGPLMSIHFGLAGNLLLMTGHAKLLLANSLGTLTLNLLLDWILIPRFGLMGAACAGALANFTISNLQIQEMNRIEKFSFGLHLHWRGFCGLLIAILPLWWIKDWSWSLRLPVLIGMLMLLILPNVLLPGTPKHPIRSAAGKIRQRFFQRDAV